MAEVKRSKQRPVKTLIRPKKRAGLRPGTTGFCEAQLWKFVGPTLLPEEEETPVEWIAAESLDQALKFMRRHHPDFIIMKAVATGIIAVLSGSSDGVKTRRRKPRGAPTGPKRRGRDHEP
jgi:hypothetical protein